MVLPSLEVGGMERMTLDLSKTLMDLGHEVSVVCVDLAGELVEAADQEEIPVHVLSSPEKGPALRKHLRNTRPDVVHLHMAPWLKTAMAARLSGSRFINTLHGVPENITHASRTSMRLAGALTHNLVLVSEALREFARSEFLVPDRKITTITNGIDVHRFSPSHSARELKNDLGIPSQSRIIGSVARLAPVKNQHLLIRAMSELQTPDAHLVLVGDGESREELEALAHALEIQERVHFLGTTVDTVPTLLAMDLFALSSKAEGLPMCLLEAMACQIPIVSTDVGGIPDLLEDGGLGRLTPSGDSAALAGALDELLAKDPVEVQEVVKEARTVCVQRYSSKAMARAYLKAYRG